ncbi:sporulation YhaL family protein [Aureibacillus halotolerans]|uniref:Sporulation protein YhaL n=1 Tax=Aureibacillus halotolerans TaxID=1508390 RepID=A0A4R6TRR9_9BACI|nr:sporulation YhaL family protein [Aureibacillus halotolerans]TDQ35392.1 sporulation protein YhaL [Aureibacillus halotolerans]
MVPEPSLIMYVLLAGILFSAVMMLRSGHKEDVEHQVYIEQEGQKYMERLKEAQDKRETDVLNVYHEESEDKKENIS